MHDDNIIELPGVVQRFRDATDTLVALRERLRELELAENTQNRSAQSMVVAADGLSSLVEELGSTAAALRATCDLTDKALDAARAFLQGTDLASLSTAIGGVATSVEAGQAATNKRLSGIAGSIESLHKKFDGELIALRNEAANTAATLKDLRWKVQQIPEKTRHKFGL